jgi:uncharacterized repeat protein (TIGR01451 family)
MVHCGGGYAVNGVTLTFDDATNNPFLPSATQIVSGTYHPTAYSSGVTFPSPAPAAPYVTNLSIFTGSNNPNGNWSLFVIDDTPLNNGVISNGWSLNLITASPVGSAADVGLALTASPNPVGVSNNLTCVIAVTNYGPSTSTGVTVTNTLPSGALFVSATGPGSWSTNGSLLVWNVGTLAYGAGATLTLTLYPTAIGSVTDSAIVSSVTSDPNPNDSAASVTVTVGSVQPPQFGTITTSNGTFHLTITSPASSTIIQASTNLLPPNWLNVYTGTPPFTFTDPNASNYPYRFYRAVLGP